MLTEAKCTIISERKNAHYDSYVLSESSLFIFPNKLLLKTCGTTTLLNAIPTLLQAAKEIGTEPVRVQFSRYDFLFPEKQPYPHNCFSSEVEYLNSYFKNGRAYILGPVYSTAAETNVISAPTIHNTAFDNSNAGNTPRWHLYIADCGATELPGADDHTFEMVMFDLDRDIMRKFYRPPTEDEKDLAEYPSSAEDSTTRAGIDMIIPGSEIDAFLFNPCGYSCNALKDELYFTIHITPEPQCSFVSFEANVHMDNYTELVQKLVDTFRPGSFCVSVFSSSDASRVDMSQQYDGFITQSSMLCQLQGNYFVNCGQFAGMNPPTCPTHPARTAMVTEELKVIFPTVSKTLPLLQPLKTDEEAVYAPSSDLEDSCNSLSQSQYPVKYVREEDDPTQLRFANSYSMIEADDLSYDIMER